MSYRAYPANVLIGWGRSLGKLLGCELAVDLNDHSITAKMQHPDKDNRAWDSNLYKSGNVFVDGYANPIKPRVEANEGLENPDEITHVEGEVDVEDDEEPDVDDDDGAHTYLIASSRYRNYMRQDLISQLLTPNEQWKLIMYAVLGNVALTFFAIIITLYATGTFGGA